MTEKPTLPEGSDSSQDVGTNRRNMIRGLAVAGVGTAVGVATATSAEAATGEAFFVGRANWANNMTYLAIGGVAGNGATAALTTERTAFWVDNRNSPIDGNGMRGDGHGAGSGVWGHTDFNGVGVWGSASPTGVSFKATGGRAHLHLVPTGTAPRSRSDAHQVGEIVADTSGDLWCCVGAGNPGTWRKLAGPSTAGQFHVLPSPVRAYDSRSGDGRLSGGGQRNITLTGVPAGASAATVSLTVTGTVGAGNLAIFRAGAATPSTSNINWFATAQTFAVTTVSGVSSSSAVTVRAGGSGSTHVIVDVIGYYS